MILTCLRVWAPESVARLTCRGPAGSFSGAAGKRSRLGSTFSSPRSRFFGVQPTNQGSSTWANVILLAGLVACALLLVTLLNGVPQQSTFQRTILNNQGPPGDGFLLIVMGTNQNPHSTSADPDNSTLFAISGKAVLILSQTDPTFGSRVMTTNSSGVANYSLPAGSYLLKFDDQTLHPVIPVVITKHNATIVAIRVTASLAPALVSDFSDLNTTGLGGQSSNFMIIHSAARVANLSDTMVVKVRGPGNALQVQNATITAEHLVPDGLWLQMRIPSEFNLRGASSVDLTVYSYSYQAVTVPIKYLAG